RKALDRILREDREAGGILRVILHELRVDADGLAEEKRFLFSLVEIVAAAENRKAGGDRTIEEVGLGEAEHEAALQVAELRGERERFAEAEEVVGLIGQADEGAGQSADAALQADRLFAFFLQLEIEIDGAFFCVALDLDGFVFFDALEVVEL